MRHSHTSRKSRTSPASPASHARAVAVGVVALLGLLAGALVVPGPVPAAAATGTTVGDVPVQRTGTGVGIGTWRLEHASGQPPVGEGRARPTVLTARVPGTMAALTWTGPGAGPVWLRSRTRLGWGRWQRLAPDPDVSRGRQRSSALLWLGASDRVQLRTGGPLPEDAALTTYDTRTVTAGAAPTVEHREAAASARPKRRTRTRRHPARPKIRSRAAWGAREAWREPGPGVNRRLRQVHVHHTATGNDYTKADVPGIINAVYAHHTKTLGWSDIGYNFLVDRFGRAWLGRKGSQQRLVQGAHTMGFNHASVGIAVIGNFEEVVPRRRVLRKVAMLAAWRLDRATPRGRVRARGKVRVTSHGSDRYPAGAGVRLPVIDGHRDTNSTECPGTYLYAGLPTIRKQAQWLLHPPRRTHRRG